MDTYPVKQAVALIDKRLSIVPIGSHSNLRMLLSIGNVSLQEIQKGQIGRCTSLQVFLFLLKILQEHYSLIPYTTRTVVD
jgi:hypothetical protein